MNQGRAMQLNNLTVKNYFEKLNSFMTEQEFMGKPGHRSNIGEKRHSLTAHHTHSEFVREKVSNGYI
jgi:hypothetical protein